jgi:hypothetical protein
LYLPVRASRSCCTCRAWHARSSAESSSGEEIGWRTQSQGDVRLRRE